MREKSDIFGSMVKVGDSISFKSLQYNAWVVGKCTGISSSGFTMERKGETLTEISAVKILN